MKASLKCLLIVTLAFLMLGCFKDNKKGIDITASDILGNPDYLAFSYRGYRQNSRDVVPSIEEFKDDMKILSAMGIKLIRTYNTQQFGHTANLLAAIKELIYEDPGFEMYAMLGTWIECKDAWSPSANHNTGNIKNNTAEIKTAVKMVNTYPDIIKIIAVGNEAMVQWAINYFVHPSVILNWVNYLKELRNQGGIPSGIWITSSDNYESWGGGANSYQTKDLADLIEAVDFISLHTYPFHDSHYNPVFWGVPAEEEHLPELQQIEAAMLRAMKYAIFQFQAASDYVSSLGIEKPIHIGETGWATAAGSSYGITGSRAADEYKEKLYYEHMRDWTNSAGLSCFYFEAFDEQWKDQGNALGSENHFGLINLKGEAKFPLWEMVDDIVFDGLTRNGLPITKTYNGNLNELMEVVPAPPLKSEMGLLEITTVNENRKPGQAVKESTYVIVHEELAAEKSNDISYPSEKLKMNAWEGTCSIEMSQDGIIEIITGTGSWWGCAIEIIGGTGENLSDFKSGQLNFEIKATTLSSFQLGFQTGSFAQGTQTNNQLGYNSDSNYSITSKWKKYSVRLDDINQGANLSDVTALLYLRGAKGFDGKNIFIKNIYYTK